MTKISIIIPVYNAEKYLRNCLESIINQTFKDIEVICIDDGSTDNSKHIIKSFSGKDERIIYCSMNKNSGSGPARNKGLNYATGEYISFIDSDDFIIDKTAYEKMYSFASENSANIVSANIKAFNEEYKFSKVKYCKEIKDYSKVPSQNYGIPWFFQKNLFKWDFLIKNNIKFPDYKRGQDPIFFANALVKTNYVYCLPIDFYAYRLSPYSIKPEEKEKELDYIKHFKHTLQILKSSEFDEMYLEYEKMMYDFFINHKIYTASKTLENNIKTVFGENSEVIQIFEMKVTALGKKSKTNPTISVIVPVYNVEKYLRKCLESIINQTLKELEIICVNDGSTDNSLAILKEYAQKDKRIKIINKMNEGLGAARKTGLDHAKGDFIAFIDSDDWIKVDAYEKIYNNAISNDSDVVISNLIRYNENKKSYTYWEGNDLTPYFEENVNFNSFYFDYTKIKPYLLNRSFSACIKLYKIDLLRGYNDFYFPKHTAFEDIPFHLQVLLRARRISFCKDKLYIYRVSNTNSISNSSRKSIKVLDIFKVVDKVENILIETKKMDELKNEFFSFKVFQLIQWFTKCDNTIKTRFFELMKESFSKINFIQELNSKEIKYLRNYQNVMNSFSYKEFVLREENDKLKMKIQKLEERVILPEFNNPKNSENILKEETNQNLLNNNIIKKNISQRVAVYQKLISKVYPLYIIFNRKNKGMKNVLINIKGYQSIKNNKLIDISYYLKENEDVRASGMDPILHYMFHGFEEGRKPNPSFNSELYLEINKDIKKSNLNPLVHYSLYGIKEGRKIKID